MNLESLIIEAKKKNPAAEKELYNRFSGYLATICFRFLKNTDQTDDCVANALVSFFRKLKSYKYKSDGKTLNYVKKAAINECLKKLKEKNLYMVAEEDGEEIVLKDDGMDKIAVDEILQLIHKLPDGYRTVLNLHSIEGYSHSEIAEMLGISESTSKTQLKKAREALKPLLIYKGYIYESSRSTT